MNTADVRSGANRVNRGGSWNNNAQNVRSANRNNNDPSNRNNNIGFRLASTFHSRTGAVQGWRRRSEMSRTAVGHPGILLPGSKSSENGGGWYQRGRPSPPAVPCPAENRVILWLANFASL